MNYEISIRKKAMKFIRKQDSKQQQRIITAIYKLPLEGDIRKMQGEDNLYRLRVGDYRVLFEMYPKDNTLTLIEITDADNRGQIYNTNSQLK